MIEQMERLLNAQESTMASFFGEATVFLVSFGISWNWLVLERFLVVVFYRIEYM